jgi:hypothetical protein
MTRLENRDSEANASPAFAGYFSPRWLMAAACVALLFELDPLLYAAAWRFFPGPWIGIVPQNFGLAVSLAGAGGLAGFVIVLTTLYQCAVGTNAVVAEGLQLAYLTVIISALGGGCAAAWIIYMLCWHVK